MAASSSQALSEEIDGLLEEYLGLLDQYDTLRKTLSSLQVSTQQHLARANFDAPRGIRYGQDYYDGRMQATRVCNVVENSETGLTTFTVSSPLGEWAGLNTNDTKDGTTDSKANDPETPQEDESEESKAKIMNTKDPIRMFGILTPQALKLARRDAIRMVEDIIPQIVTVGAQMKEIEIRIRRARKHRAKAEAAEGARRASLSSILHGGRGEALVAE